LNLLPDLNFARRDSAISLDPHADDQLFEDQVVLKATTNEFFPKPRLLQPFGITSPSCSVGSPAPSTISSLDQPSSGVVDQNTFALIQAGIEKKSSKFIGLMASVYA
jgi:hypothetical protein